MAFIPLVSLGRVIGKFMLYYDAPHAFDDEEVSSRRHRRRSGVRRGAWQGRGGGSPERSVAGNRDDRRQHRHVGMGDSAGIGPRRTPDGLPSGTLRQVRQCTLESSRDCLKILDLDGRLIYINRAGLERLGVRIT